MLALSYSDLILFLTDWVCHYCAALPWDYHYIYISVSKWLTTECKTNAIKSDILALFKCPGFLIGICCRKNKAKKSLGQNQLSQNQQNVWTASYLHLNLLFSVIYRHSSYCLNTWLPPDIRYNYLQLRNLWNQMPTECISTSWAFWYWKLNTFMVLRHSTSFINFLPLFHLYMWTLCF